MRSYLDLVPIAAKVRKKQNFMSIFCIVLSVFLVTAIFGMADMFIRSQILRAQRDYGNWHIIIKNISDEDAKIIAARPDIEAFSPYGVFNYYSVDLGYTLGGKQVLIAGGDESCITKIFTGELEEGVFPKARNEVLVTQNAKLMLDLHIGDSITVSAPNNDKFIFTISGFLTSTASIMKHDCYGVFLRTEDYYAVYPDPTGDTPADYDIAFYVQFAGTRNLQREIANIKEKFNLTDEQVSVNNELVGLLGQSRDSFMMQIYAAALILFILVLSAGCMMIASSLNSNVAQRTEFFGLMRCIGATPKQVMRLVRREALDWCSFAIPAGVGSGVIVIWVLCAVLRYLSPEYFADMPVFGVSMPSIVSGVVVGLFAVILAARAPAKKAAKVSPLTAVSGNVHNLKPLRKAANIRFLKIDTALGVYHAKSSRNNFILMVGSFSLSIILFLSFSVTVEFMQHSLTPMHPWTADISIISPDNTCSVDETFLDKLNENPAVKSAYGRMFAYDVPGMVNGHAKTVDLISYEQKQFDWAEDYVLEGSLEEVQENNNTGLIVYEPQNTIKVGDTVRLNVNGQTAEIKIAGMLSECPFNNAADVGTIICSENTFRQITGESDYTIIDVQLTSKASDEDVNKIQSMAGSGYTFSDERIANQSTRGIYYCFWLFIYGFLVLIALITVFNVINSIAISVAARTKQYGAFRAIGLSIRQLSNMVIAEASTYAAVGSIVGSAIGLACNKLLFHMLVSYRWGDAWSVPWAELGVIVLVILFSVVLSVYGPIKKIKRTSIVDTISAQ